ncbi:MAG TPA: zinc ribbon domain-containing protein [Vicinamibacteria bacterium]|jgi:putative FmdB family regulatory protein
MPIYEYVCRECGQRFEKLVRSWGETVVCPGCRAEAVEKQVSSFAFAGGGPAAGSGGCGCGRGGCGCGH